MSELTAQYSKLRFVERLEETEKFLEKSSFDNIAEPYIGRIARLKKILKILLEYFRNLDPDIVPLEVLNQCTGQIDNLRSYCEQFCNSKNQGHIDNATSCVNNIINYTRIHAALTDLPGLKVAQATTASTEEVLKGVIELNSKHKAEISGQASRIKELEKIIEQHKAKESELTQAIEQHKLRLDKITSDFQTQFSTTQSQRAESFTKSTEQFSEKFTTQSGEFKNQFESLIKDQKTTFDEHINSTNQNTKEYLAHLELRKSEVDNIYGAIGSASLAGNFKETADKEHRAANLLRWISLGLMGAMIIVGIITYCASLIHPEIDWKLFGFRLATVIVIAIPAVYAAQESSKHRERERKNRKLQIELATIDAYLALLPKPKQDEIKGNLTNKFFGTDEAPEKNDDVTKHALFDVLKSAVNNLTKAK